MINFLEDYIIWHYTKGIMDLLKNIKMFFWFNNHFFSYSFLLKTLISPFMNIREKKINFFSFESVGSFIIVNMLMRILGFAIRTLMIIIGLFFLVLTAMVSLIILIIWLIMPIFVAALLIDSLYIIFS